MGDGYRLFEGSKCSSSHNIGIETLDGFNASRMNANVTKSENPLGFGQKRCLTMIRLNQMAFDTAGQCQDNTW